jgi:SCF-associated factor 1
VVAGWDCSTAYITHHGVVIWKEASPLDCIARGAGEISQADGILVESDTLPNTWYQRPRGNQREASAEAASLGQSVGEVVNHVALEGFVVLLTDLGKIFAAPTDPSDHIRSGIVELTGFEPTAGRAKMREIQGKFRTFAVFNTEGDVVLGDTALVQRAWQAFTRHEALPDAEAAAKRPAALQNRGITSLAFGDWHALALTSEGHILSFGRGPQSCGCLGLGRWDEGSVLRGVTTISHWPHDSELVGALADTGRRIWFSPEQREWLRYMLRSGLTQEELSRITGPNPDQARHVKISDWFEKHGADWDLHEELDDDRQAWGNGQSSYVALSISAAGWHSGALVLTNDDRVKKSHDLHREFLDAGTGGEPLGGDRSSTAVGYVVGAKRWLSSWLQETKPECEASPEEDQKSGRDHACYHSRRSPRDVAPDVARHPITFSAEIDLVET